MECWKAILGGDQELGVMLSWKAKEKREGKNEVISSSPAWVFWSIFLFLTASFFSHSRFGNEKYCFGGKNKV